MIKVKKKLLSSQIHFFYWCLSIEGLLLSLFVFILCLLGHRFLLYYHINLKNIYTPCLYIYKRTRSVLRINFYLLRTFPPKLGSFLCCFFFHYVSAKFHLWPSSGDLPRPRIGMLSLVTVSPVITAFPSCCLSHHVFDQVNLWPAWVGFETAIF